MEKFKVLIGKIKAFIKKLFKRDKKPKKDDNYPMW